MKRVIPIVCGIAVLATAGWLALRNRNPAPGVPVAGAGAAREGVATRGERKGQKGHEASEGFRKHLPRLSIDSVTFRDESKRETVRKLLAEKRFREAIEQLSPGDESMVDDAVVLVWQSWMEADRDGMLDYVTRLPDLDGGLGQSAVKGIFQVLAFTSDPADVEWVKAAAGRVTAENWLGMLYFQVSDYWLVRGAISAEDYFSLHDSFPQRDMKGDVLRGSISQALEYTAQLEKSGDISVYERQQMAEGLLEQIALFRNPPSADEDPSNSSNPFGNLVADLAAAKAKGSGLLSSFAAYQPPPDADMARGFASGVGKGLAASGPVEIRKLVATAGGENGELLWSGYLTEKAQAEPLTKYSQAFQDSGLPGEQIGAAADAAFQFQMKQNPEQFARELRDLPEGVFRDRLAAAYVVSRQQEPGFDAAEWKALVRDKSLLQGSENPPISR